VQVRAVFIGNFDDSAAAREAAVALLEEGADFLMHQANDAGRGVFLAVSERAGRGERVYAFGTNRNQNDMAPEVVLASATLDIPAAFVEVARRVRDGSFQAAAIRLGLADGIVALELNPALADAIPTQVRAELDSREADIRDGRLAVPRGDF
jgi:basic membrane lipoprotein Med (substrate-binding protein (PBP1-ABC) superfamily)